ncbi:MAG: hypothetical protein PVG07_15490 [Acidobacteriota bacterium]|jgi:hypothetical protein
MPIVERDPWRMQYFEHVVCPEELFIPTEDSDSYRLYPDHRWVYNKLLIAESQGLDAAPHGLAPEHFPVFSKPIYNLRGMGIESRVLDDHEDYERYQTAGHMWMPLLEGEHVSSDAAVLDGEAVWWRHTTGKPLEGGMFDYWTIEAEARPELERQCGEWLGKHLRGYTGAVNFETIGGTIIECHLRFADQWPDLYGAGWLDALVELYRDGRWTYPDADRRTGYSVVLFGAHGPRYRRVDPALLDELRGQPEISSVQITFHRDKPPGRHAMPPGGFRLAIVNCWSLDAGIEARRRLALGFWSTQRLRRRRGAR